MRRWTNRSSLRLEGRATIQGREVVRPAVPAEDMMQAFAYRHLVPAAGPEGGRDPTSAIRFQRRILSALPVRIPAGDGAGSSERAWRPTFDKIQLELSEPPEGISVREVSLEQQDAQIVLQGDAAKASPACVAT